MLSNMSNETTQLGANGNLECGSLANRDGAKYVGGKSDCEGSSSACDKDGSPGGAMSAGGVSGGAASSDSEVKLGGGSLDANGTLECGRLADSVKSESSKLEDGI